MGQHVPLPPDLGPCAPALAGGHHHLAVLQHGEHAAPPAQPAPSDGAGFCRLVVAIYDKMPNSIAFSHDHGPYAWHTQPAPSILACTTARAFCRGNILLEASAHAHMGIIVGVVLTVAVATRRALHRLCMR